MLSIKALTFKSSGKTKGIPHSGGIGLGRVVVWFVFSCRHKCDGEVKCD